MKVEGYHYCKVPDLALRTRVGVVACFEDDMDVLWLDAGEGQTQVNYCPFCGKACKGKGC